MKEVVEIPLIAARAVMQKSQTELMDILRSLGAGPINRQYLGLLENDKASPTVLLAMTLNEYFNKNHPNIFGDNKTICIKFDKYELDNRNITHEEFIKNFFSHHKE